MFLASGAHSDPGSTDKAFQCLELQFLICKLGRDISALNNFCGSLTGMWKLGARECRGQVLSRPLLNGRVRDWGWVGLKAMVHLFLG